jgi:hypothetical protein
MIKALTGVISMLLAAMSVVAQPATTVDPAEGTSSTPGVLALPQLGSVGFRCSRSWAVQPFFDLAPAVATEEVTIRAGSLTKRNFVREIVGRSHGRAITRVAVAQIRQLALPFGHYRNVTFTVRQSTEARAIAAIVGAEFVAGKFRAPADSEEFAKCYVKRWAVRIDVSPY